MKQKILFFFALLLFFSNIAFAQAPTLPSGVILPDNIIDADCVGTAPSVTWTFKQLAESPAAYPVDDSCIPLVGDIDGDGKIEVVVFGRYFASPYCNVIYIFEIAPDNNGLSLQQKIDIPSTNVVNNPYAIASVDDNGYASIYLCTSYYNNTAANQLQLIKYSYNPIAGKYEHSWQTKYSARNDREMGQPMLVDFNGDGVPEVVVLDKVYNSRTGALLVDGGHLANDTNGFGFGGHLVTASRWVSGAPTTWSSIMAIGDVDGDGVPEVIGGKTVYKVAINNPDTQDGTNTFEILRHVNTTGHAEAVDGPTAIADMTGDGQLDVVVTGNRKNGTASVYVWDPRTGDVLHTNSITNIPTISNDHSASVPLIGDIDNDGIPEIVLTGLYVTRAYEFNAGAKTITQKWSVNTNDNSVATGMVMFDFDQNGAQEIVYRDVTHLRILNGSDGSDKITPISCSSSTANEYPVVVDINNDQAAEIVVTTAANGGRVRIFSSQNANEKWAPTRKVWNQYAYNAVNVNEDLTIPRIQMNSATAFAGADEMLGDGNDIHPFNGYLVQQTMLNKFGEPLWLIPNGEIVGDPTFFYNNITDHLSITIQVKNIGDATFQDPFYLTIYKDNIGNPLKQHVHKHEATIAKDETVSITIEIANYYATFEAGKLVINLNDKGDGSMDQSACGTCSEESHFGFVQIEECIKNPKILINDVSLPGTVTYQWQSSPDAKNWTDIVGETNSSYIVLNEKTGTNYYKVVVDNGSVRTDGALTKMIVYRCVMPINPNIHLMK